MARTDEEQYGIPFLQDLERAREYNLGKLGTYGNIASAFLNRGVQGNLNTLGKVGHYFTGIDFSNDEALRRSQEELDRALGRKPSKATQPPAALPVDTPAPMEPLVPAAPAAPASKKTPTQILNAMPAPEGGIPELTANYSLPAGIPIPEPPVTSSDKEAIPDFGSMSVGEFANYALGQKARTRQAKTAYYQSLTQAQKASTALLPYKAQIERARADAEIRMKNAQIRAALVDLKKNPVANKIVTNQLRKIAEAFGAVLPQQAPSAETAKNITPLARIVNREKEKKQQTGAGGGF